MSTSTANIYPAPFYPEARETAGVTVDANSLVRNTLAVANVAAPVIAVSSVLGGALGVPNGLAIVRDAVVQARFASACGDRAGALHQVALGAGGGGYAGVSAFLGATGVAALKGAALPAVLTPLAVAFGGVMALGILAYSGYGLKEARAFSREFKEAQAKETVNDFLLRQRSLAPSALARRVGVECAEKIISGSSLDLTEVEKANFKLQVKHSLLLVIGALTLIAFLLVLFVAGPYVPLLFAIGALLWLANDSSHLHNYVGDKFWEWYREGEQQIKGPLCKTPEDSLELAS